MPIVTGMTLKELSITIGLFVAIIGGGINYGQTIAVTRNTQKTVDEVKEDVKENQKINVEQTVSLKEQSIILKQVASSLSKVVDKLEK